MVPATPLARGRTAFAALCLSLSLIATERTVATGDPWLLDFTGPAIAVIATGHVDGREALLRAAISTAIYVAAGFTVNVLRGRGIPDFSSFQAFTSALTGLFALHLILILIASFALKRLWPESDHWTL